MFQLSMPFDDLSKFLQAAADAGELERIAVSLQPDQEIAALSLQISREFQSTSPVILFEDAGGNSVSVVTNLLGNRTRLLRALGAERFEEVIERLRNALDPFPVSRDRKFGFGSIADRNRFAPRNIRRGLSQQVIKLGKDLNLHELPVLRSWAGESGPIITAGVVVTESLDRKPTLERMPLEVIDEQTLRLHWDLDRPCFRHWQSHREHERQLPVAISLGGDPLLGYVAGLPLPEWIDPWNFTGILRNENLNLIRARSVELNIPAEAEIVLEGYLDPHPTVGQGTAAGPLGTLVSRSELPSMRLTAITHRANPIYPARVQAFDHSEETVCAQLTERLLLHVLRMTNPVIEDLHLPSCGACRQAVFVSTSASETSQIDQLTHAICSLPLIGNASLVILVDADVDVRNVESLWKEVTFSLPLTEPRISKQGTSSRLILDATSISRGRHEVQRCEPTPEVLETLARAFANSRWEVSENSVPTPTASNLTSPGQEP